MISRRTEYPFIPCRNYTTASTRNVDLVVVHTMESPEKPDTAEAVASWANGPNSPRASWHYAIDANSIVQCVLENNVAWGAPGANHDGIQLEHAGYARQSESDWSDSYSLAMLRRSASLAAKLVRDYEIPIRHLSVSQLRNGERGFIGHIDATNAFSGGSGHWDPGPNFPWPRYLRFVQEELNKLVPPKPSEEQEFWLFATWWLGEGQFKGEGPRSKPRPTQLRKRIPVKWWLRLARFLAKRKRG